MDNTNEIEMFSPEEMLSPFESIKETDAEGHEWWNSRKLAKLMGYQKYWNFERLMDKVTTFLQQEKGLDLKEHMVEIEEMAQLGSGTVRSVKSYKLSRTACIAISSNADQKKPTVKAAKEFFMSKMESQELATSMEGNVLIYRSTTGKVNVTVVFNNGNLWLSQKRMSDLYAVDVSTINYHLKQINDTGELHLSDVIRKIQIPSEKWDEQGILLYNLDAIIAVGYRVMKRSSILEARRKAVNPEVRERVELSFQIVDRIHEILTEKGLKQKDLALQLGKKEAEISKWMRGTHNFTIDTLVSIEQALDAPILEVVHKEEEVYA